MRVLPHYPSSALSPGYSTCRICFHLLLDKICSHLIYTYIHTSITMYDILTGFADGLWFALLARQVKGVLPVCVHNAGVCSMLKQAMVAFCMTSSCCIVERSTPFTCVAKRV